MGFELLVDSIYSLYKGGYSFLSARVVCGNLCAVLCEFVM